MATTYTISEFCIQCGASFPPKDGEGICMEWKECYRKQGEYDATSHGCAQGKDTERSDKEASSPRGLLSNP